MKLISMTDFVLQEERKGMQNTDRHLRFERILKYANFLKQPLKLEMFVSCDEEGNVLKDPGLIPSYELEQYQKAKEKVLFEGFDDIEAINYHISRKRNIEYLSKFGTLSLTPNATKQFL